MFLSGACIACCDETNLQCFGRLRPSPQRTWPLAVHCQSGQHREAVGHGDWPDGQRTGAGFESALLSGESGSLVESLSEVSGAVTLSTNKRPLLNDSADMVSMETGVPSTSPPASVTRIVTRPES